MSTNMNKTQNCFIRVKKYIVDYLNKYKNQNKFEVLSLLYFNTIMRDAKKIQELQKSEAISKVLSSEYLNQINDLKEKVRRNNHFISNIITECREKDNKIRMRDEQILEDQIEISNLEEEITRQRAIIEELKDSKVYRPRKVAKKTAVKKSLEITKHCHMCGRGFAKKNHLTNHMKSCKRKNRDVIIIDDIEFFSSPRPSY